MSHRDHVIVVGAYDNAGAARRDFGTLRAVDDVGVVASVLLSRDADGKVVAREHGGRLFAPGMTVGGFIGVVIGLFAPPLLIPLGLAGAGVGSGIAALIKRHEERGIGVDAEAWLPPGGTAIVAAARESYAERIEKSLSNATRKVRQTVNPGDYRAVVKAVRDSDPEIFSALSS